MRQINYSHPPECGITIVPSLRLSELRIYPIKSARGSSLSSAHVALQSLEHDRRWMVVDEQGRFLTQRSIPRMALVRVELGSSHLAVRAECMEDLLLPLRPVSGETLRVRAWNDSFDATDTGPEAASWFTKMLSRHCRLVFMPDQADRVISPEYAPQETALSLADAFPFLLISQASLDDLNSRPAGPVLMNRFRPNLVLEGCNTYDEDTWATLRIGTVGFRVAKPCSRCTVPMVNQDTGIRAWEPILTLRSYRTTGGKICFSQNLTHEAEGILMVGDEVHTTRA
jgi:uncharacterized protein YcbX